MPNMSVKSFHAKLKIAIILAVTVFLAFGFLALDGGEDEGNSAFLPDGSDLVAAQNSLATSFPSNTNLVSVQFIARGPALTTANIGSFSQLMEDVAQDADIAPHLVVANPIISYAHLYQNLSQAPALASSPSQPEALLVEALEDESTSALAQNLNDLLARDDTGEIIGGIGIMTLNIADGQDAAVDSAQLKAEELSEDYAFTDPEADLEVSTLSIAKQTKESEDAQASSTVLLLVLALAVIAVVLTGFYRSASDVILSLLGLMITILWAFGIQAWLGPGGAGWLGPTTSLIIMVPVILIGLCVDYSLQITGRYRESLKEETADDPNSNPVKPAMFSAVRHSILPLALAGGTTAISFFTNLTSDISANRDFGVIAGLGVLAGLVVMTTFVPAIRYLLDNRRQAKSKTLKTRHLADSIPGMNALFGWTTRISVNKPLNFLGPALILTILAIWGSANLTTSFSSSLLSPSDAETTEDTEYLSDYVGGQTEIATILIEAELTNDRTIRNVIDLENDLQDVSRRPVGITGSVAASFGTLVQDWITDSGLPGDKYDPDLAEAIATVDTPLIFTPEQIDILLDAVQAVDPAGFAEVVSRNPDGADKTILQVQTLVGDTDLTRQLAVDVDNLWYGDPDEITMVAGEILSVEVVDELTSSQTSSVLLTIAVAALVLLLFFGFTEFRPMLGVLAILPIALVLLWVLGTMTLLGISYNVITALITALSIGIGVDYTIHFIHRFLEEMEHTGGVIRNAIAATKKTTGGALLGSAFTTVLGFLVLIFSPIEAMQQFGFLTALTIFYSLVATIVVLPPMLSLWALYHRWRANNFNMPPTPSTSAALSGAAGSTQPPANTTGSPAAKVHH